MSATRRPSNFYLYGPSADLLQILHEGSFVLRAWPPVQDVAVAQSAASGFLTLAFATVYKDALHDRYGQADACLCIYGTEEFGERLHRSVERALPDWAGIDAAITYGANSPLGLTFARRIEDASSLEWQFAWRRKSAGPALLEQVIRIGNIEHLARLRLRGEAAAGSLTN